MINVNGKISSGNFDIEISGTVAAVQDDWKLLEEEGRLTPFQRRAWLLPFYNVLAPQLNVVPVFVLVRDKPSRRPVMLLLLCALRRFGITIIEFADLGVSDYNAPVIAKTFNPSLAEWQELWGNIIAALKKGSILWLEKMPSMIGDLPNPLAQYNGKSELMSVASWGVTLPSTFVEYNKNVLHPSFTKELAKKNRRVAKRGEVEYAIAQTPDEKRAAFDILARQRQARFDEMGRVNILARPVYRRFYEAVAIESPEALARLALLKVGGEGVGTILALNHHKGLHVIMSTFEGGEWKSCSLGNVIMQSAIEHSISDGINFFDLTIGNEGYKQHFGAAPNALYYAVHPLAPIGLPIALLLTCRTHIKETIKRAIPGIERKTRQTLDYYKTKINYILRLFGQPVHKQSHTGIDA